MNDECNSGKKPTLMQMLSSVCLAAFGVSDNRHRERDFKYGSPVAFAVLGIIGTVLFVLTVALVVKMVLKQAGV